MIKYNLKCHNDHEFESWFSNSKEYDKLNKKALLECIYCSSKRINKSIMAPTILNLKLGNDAFKCYTCDFTHDYIDINSDYRN